MLIIYRETRSSRMVKWRSDWTVANEGGCDSNIFSSPKCNIIVVKVFSIVDFAIVVHLTKVIHRSKFINR